MEKPGVECTCDASGAASDGPSLELAIDPVAARISAPPTAAYTASVHPRGVSQPPSILAWSWLLPNGQEVFADVDAASGVETVRTGGRVVARSPTGGSPDGHSLVVNAPAMKAGDAGAPFRQSGEGHVHLRLDPVMLTFTLTFNGAQVSPMSRPAVLPEPRTSRRPGGPSLRPTPPPLPSAGFPVMKVVVPVGLLALGVLLWLVRPWVSLFLERLGTDAVQPVYERSPNMGVGLERPADFEVQRGVTYTVTAAEPGDNEVLHGREGTLVLVQREHVDTKVVASWRGRGHGAGELGTRMMTMVAADLGQGGPMYREVERREGSCGSGKGGNEDSVELAGELTYPTKTLRVWSCTFASEGHIYTVGYTLNTTDSSDKVRVRSMTGRIDLRGTIPCARSGPCQDITVR